MNVFLFLVTGIGLMGLALATMLSLIGKQKLRAAIFGVTLAAWGSAYSTGLVLASLTSHQVVLRPGETKYFCGFYLDCHIGVAVVGDSVTHSIGALPARHNYHVLTLQFSSSALRATLKPYDLRMTLLGSNGARYPRMPEAEDALAGLSGHEPLARDIPAGGSYTARVVFDVPDDAGPVRLHVAEGLGIDRLIESVLIGDEDSFLHRRVLLALPPASVGLVPARR